MTSAAKALQLLSLFDTTQPEIGLSQICRLAKRDKATTYRYLTTLERAGFVEQNPLTKSYRLGPALLQLGRMREMTVPREAGAEAPLRRLSDTTGETAHISVLSGTTLYALMSFESPRHSTRAVIDIQVFPLHATASGLCALAFGPDDLFAIACDKPYRFTEKTPTTPQELKDLISVARIRGFARSDGRFEREIHSLSAPLFDSGARFAGAVTVASVASRFMPALEKTIIAGLVAASREITQSWGGQIPATVERAWAETCAQVPVMDKAP